MSSPARSRARPKDRDGRGRSVYPHDAEDIKAHKWFRDIPWDQLCFITPPFVPRIAGVDDTHYFDEEEPISDWSDSDSEDDDDDTGSEGSGAAPHPPLEANPLAINAVGITAPTPDMMGMSPFAPPIPGPAGIVHNVHPSTAIRRNPRKTVAMQAKLATFPRHLQGLLAQFVATPYDTTRLKRMDREINALTATASAPSNNNNAPPMAQAQPQQQVQFQEVELGDQMKAFIRTFGRRERKRPRDRLLRDRKTKATVLKVRKQTAFLGYTYRRVMDGADDDDDGDGVPQHRSCNSVVVNNGNGNTLDANIDNNIVLVPSTLDGVEKMPSPRMYLHPGVGVGSGPGCRGQEVVGMRVAMRGGVGFERASAVADTAVGVGFVHGAAYSALPQDSGMVRIRW